MQNLGLDTLQKMDGWMDRSINAVCIHKWTEVWNGSAEYFAPKKVNVNEVLSRPMAG